MSIGKVCLFLVLCCLCLTGCYTPRGPIPGFEATAKDKLTRAELENLIYHGKRFAVRSESVKRKLTPAQINYVQNTKPVVSEKYTAPKYGLLEMRWRITRITELILRSRGPLDVEKQNWELEICVTQESAPLPEGMISKDLEKNLRLPPK